MERIEADILIPGHGEPIRDGCVVLDGPTIAYAGPTAGAPATPGAEIYRVPGFMPGLWDCHAHFMGVFTPDLAELATNAPSADIGILADPTNVTHVWRGGERMKAPGELSPV